MSRAPRRHATGDGLHGFLTWRRAFMRTPLSAAHKAVLQALAAHMSDAGDSCFPAQETLAWEASVTERTVRDVLADCAAWGWIRRRKHGFGDRRWARYEYEASIPDDYWLGWESDPRILSLSPVQVRNDVPDQASNEDRKEIPDEKPKEGNDVPYAAARSGTLFHEVRNQFPTNSSGNSPKEQEQSTQGSTASAEQDLLGLINTIGSRRFVWDVSSGHRKHLKRILAQSSLVEAGIVLHHRWMTWQKTPELLEYFRPSTLARHWDEYRSPALVWRDARLAANMRRDGGGSTQGQEQPPIEAQDEARGDPDAFRAAVESVGGGMARRVRQRGASG